MSMSNVDARHIETLANAYNISRETAAKILEQPPSPMVDSRTIGIIASKRNFDPDKERKYIEKAKTTKCRCKHYTQTRPCFYRTCRHFPEQHYGLAYISRQEGTKMHQTWTQLSAAEIAKRKTIMKAAIPHLLTDIESS